MDIVEEEDMHWVADEWYEELSVQLEMWRFENLGKILRGGLVNLDAPDVKLKSW